MAWPLTISWAAWPRLVTNLTTATKIQPVMPGSLAKRFKQLGAIQKISNNLNSYRYEFQPNLFNIR